MEAPFTGWFSATGDTAATSEATLWDVLDLIVKAYEHGREHGQSHTAHEYEAAFSQGRLRKRKVRGKNEYKVDFVSRPLRTSPPGPATQHQE